MSLTDDINLYDECICELGINDSILSNYFIFNALFKQNHPFIHSLLTAVSSVQFIKSLSRFIQTKSSNIQKTVCNNGITFNLTLSSYLHNQSYEYSTNDK